MAEIKKIRTAIFPLPGIELEGEYKVADHINLSGKAIKGLGFIPITDLYIDKKNPQAIVVACLKADTEPSPEEAKTLLENNVKAYSYDLIEPALYAAADGKQVEATAFVPKLASGFSVYSGVAAIKESGKADLGLIVSDHDCIWAGTFTSNKAKAACVDHNIAKLGKKVRALICNSGNANACTGKAGFIADKKLQEIVAAKFSLQVEEVLTASTGKIGVELDTTKIEAALAKELDGDIKSFANAILTTDLTIKIAQDDNFSVFAKGSGMIHPQMATMLAFVITDKRIQGLDEARMQKKMQEILKSCVDESFNSITVDGDTSTNDMVLLMNNMQGKELDEKEFTDSLREVLQDLAQKIVRDGEGATKFIELELYGIPNDLDARKLAREILSSSLVKTAIFGNDPNWGRIISACGQAAAENQIEIDFDKASLEILGVELFKESSAVEFDREALAQKMSNNKDIDIKLSFTGSDNSVKAWASDLSYDYVRINAEYFT